MLAQIQDRLKYSVTDRTFQIERTCVLSIDGRVSKLNKIIYVSRNSEEIIDWKVKSLEGESLSSLLTDEFGEYHKSLITGSMEQNNLNYFKTMRKRILACQNRMVYRQFDVIVQLSTCLEPGVNYMLGLVPVLSQERFLVVNQAGRLVGFSDDFSFGLKNYKKQLAMWTNGIPSEVIQKVKDALNDNRKLVQTNKPPNSDHQSQESPAESVRFEDKDSVENVGIDEEQLGVSISKVKF